MEKTNKQKIIQTAYDYLSSKTVEHQIVLFIDNAGEVRLIDVSSTDSTQYVHYSLDILLEAKKTHQLKGKKVYTAHNHPSGNNNPSSMDFKGADEFQSLLRLNGIDFGEEFIVTKTGVSSFAAPRENSLPDIIEADACSHSHPNSDIEIFKEPLQGEKLYHSTLRKVIREKLIDGFEVAFSNNCVYFTEQFTFEALLNLTSTKKEVIIFGVPQFKCSEAWERINDIENVFGSIEFYSSSDDELVNLKEEMIL